MIGWGEPFGQSLHRSFFNFGNWVELAAEAVDGLRMSNTGLIQRIEGESGEAIAERVKATRDTLLKQVGRRIVGQSDVIELLLTGLLARGHVLLTGLPGLGKTRLVKALADSLHLTFRRVQFTPDLMPADILGTEVVEEDRQTGRRLFRYVRGPVFTNVLLADEINRTPPKTQAALLEAMGEGQVTAAGETHALPSPFFVLATQNPIELEGTYPLPEAQLDRFLFNVTMRYLDFGQEVEMVRETTSTPDEVIEPVLSGDDLMVLQRLVREVPAASNVVEYAVKLVCASRPGSGAGLSFVQDNVRWGAGSRASQALVLAAKVRALLDGRYNASIDDIRFLALPVLRHRIIPSFRADAEGINTDAIVKHLVESVVP